MTNRERARAIVVRTVEDLVLRTPSPVGFSWAKTSGETDAVDKVTDFLEATIDAAVAEAVREERERCCKAVCWKCRDGVELNHGRHMIEGESYPCKVAAIRARGEGGA